MTHIPLKQIDPLTTGVLRITVKDGAGLLVSDATASADVLQPSGKRVANDVAFVNVGSGVYTMTIEPGWSDAGSGKALTGVFSAVVTITRGGNIRTKKFDYLVAFTE